MKQNIETSVKSPVVLIIFNRKEYTELVWKAITKAQPKKLFVIADGPRTEEERQSCNIVRKITEEITWTCDVHRIYSDKNLGTKKRISSGLNEVFGIVDRAIILEDDCLPGPSFFQFCDYVLEKYAKEDRVGMISGSQPVRGWSRSSSYIFSRYCAIWGWATWQRAWSRYDKEMSSWPDRKKKSILKHDFNHKGLVKYLTSLFDKAYNNSINSWATHWFYTMLTNKWFSVVPTKNLVSNIGVIGVHSSPGINNNAPLEEIDMNNLIERDTISWDETYDLAFFDQSFPNQIIPDLNSIVLRILVRIKRFIKNLIKHN